MKSGISFCLLMVVATCYGFPAEKDSADLVADPISLPADSELEPVEEVNPELVSSDNKEEKLFFPFLTFSGSLARPPSPSSTVVVANPGPTVQVVQAPAPAPAGQLIVIPNNTTISVVSPNQPITVQQSGAPTIISQG